MAPGSSPCSTTQISGWDTGPPTTNTGGNIEIMNGRYSFNEPHKIDQIQFYRVIPDNVSKILSTQGMMLMCSVWGTAAHSLGKVEKDKKLRMGFSNGILKIQIWNWTRTGWTDSEDGDDKDRYWGVEDSEGGVEHNLCSWTHNDFRY